MTSLAIILFVAALLLVGGIKLKRRFSRPALPEPDALPCLPIGGENTQKIVPTGGAYRNRPPEADELLDPNSWIGKEVAVEPGQAVHLMDGNYYSPCYRENGDLLTRFAGTAVIVAHDTEGAIALIRSTGGFASEKYATYVRISEETLQELKVISTLQEREAKIEREEREKAEREHRWNQERDQCLAEFERCDRLQTRRRYYRQLTTKAQKMAKTAVPTPSWSPIHPPAVGQKLWLDKYYRLSHEAQEIIDPDRKLHDNYRNGAGGGYLYLFPYTEFVPVKYEQDSVIGVYVAAELTEEMNGLRPYHGKSPERLKMCDWPNEDEVPVWYEQVPFGMLVRLSLRQVNELPQSMPTAMAELLQKKQERQEREQQFRDRVRPAAEQARQVLARHKAQVERIKKSVK